MNAEDDIVERLSALVGISASYTDAHGATVDTPLAVRRDILGHLGFPAGTQDEARDSLARAEALRNGLLPRLSAVTAGHPVELALRGTTADSVQWRLTNEAGSTQEGRGATRTAAGRSVLRLPALEAGYYDVTVQAGDKTSDATLIVAPACTVTS
jgi:(1->4)-alpha-D-glucan 1-alpha-D-glucosylmutase